MKSSKWLVTGGFFILVIIVWLLYFYLTITENRNNMTGGKTVQYQAEVQLHKENESDYMLAETVKQFVRALYSGETNIAAKYVTERGKAEIIPPSGNIDKQKVAEHIVVHEVQIYKGTITATHAQVIAAVTRTVTVSEIVTTSTHYVQLELLKDDVWHIDTAAVLADVPMR